MMQNELSRTAELLREVVLPLQYYSETAKSAELAKYTESKLADLIAEDERSILVARSTGEELIGFCINRYDDGVIWLAWFGVREGNRGEGVADAILDALDDAAMARGCDKIWCDTRTENVRSQRVLQRAGFSKLCLVSHHWYGHDYFLWDKLVAKKVQG